MHEVLDAVLLGLCSSVFVAAFKDICWMMSLAGHHHLAELDLSKTLTQLSIGVGHGSSLSTLSFKDDARLVLSELLGDHTLALGGVHSDLWHQDLGVACYTLGYGR